MNSSYHSTTHSLLKKFNSILDRLAEDEKNLNLDKAIISWCKELSLERFSSHTAINVAYVPKTIVSFVNLWLAENTIIELTVKMFVKLLKVTDNKLNHGFGNLLQTLNNVSPENFQTIAEETKNTISTQDPENIVNVAEKAQNNVPIKSILLIAFVLTGIGFLLFILNNKRKANKNHNFNNSNIARQQPSSYIAEKYVLILLIKSDRYQDLIHSLKNNSCLQPEDSSKLYGATQGLWIGIKSKFKESQIKQELDNCNPVTTTSEYDVHFVTIVLDENDSRFCPDVNPMDRRDAFVELEKRSPQITVSPRLSCKAYETTEFYNR